MAALSMDRDVLGPDSLERVWARRLLAVVVLVALDLTAERASEGCQLQYSKRLLPGVCFEEARVTSGKECRMTRTSQGAAQTQLRRHPFGARNIWLTKLRAHLSRTIAAPAIFPHGVAPPLLPEVLSCKLY